jgi:hypothetical protein
VSLASVWHGDTDLRQRFQQVIERNCSCEIDIAGQRNGKCAAHQSLLDQRFLDGLLFSHYLLERLLNEEHGRA